MENDYKVRFYMDNTYLVVTESENDYETHFKGDLSDCYAWIKLTNGGFM
jgi:hypothetical protein|tara:strand:- start:734 stop:880 length:147 start_codon:yes stop_codon:yes gene_type:complete